MPALEHRTILVTGITDASSLALHCAAQLRREGARVVCTGLGPTPHHVGLSDKAAAYLTRSYGDFLGAVRAATSARLPSTSPRRCASAASGWTACCIRSPWTRPFAAVR